MRTTDIKPASRRRHQRPLAWWLLLLCGSMIIGGTASRAQQDEVNLRVDNFRDYSPNPLYPGTTLSYLNFDLHNASFIDVVSPIFVEIFLSRNSNFGDGDDVTIGLMTMDVVVPWGQTINVVLNAIYISDAELLSDLRIPADACGYYTNAFMQVTFPRWSDYTNSRAYPVSTDNLKSLGRPGHVINHMGPAPTVQSVRRLAPTSSSTSASLVTWRVTFSQAVNGVAPNDFAVIPVSGFISNFAIIGLQQPAANLADVTVGTGVSNGVLRLDVPANASIYSVCEVQMTSAFTNGATYTINHANPPASLQVLSVVVPSTTNGPLSSADVVFSGPIDPGTFTYQDLTLTLNGAPVVLDATVTTTLFNGNTYRINGLAPLTAGEGSYMLTVIAGGINDSSGHSGTGTSSSTWNNIAVLVTYTILTPEGATSASANAITGSHQGGGVDGHAAIWSGTASSFVDLNPVSATASWVSAVNGSQQAGSATVGGQYHAAIWSGASNSFVDLNPAVATSSGVYGTSGSQQAGYVFKGGAMLHAALWSGTSNSFVDLHPCCYATESGASGISGAQQVGYFTIGGYDHASMWSGTSNSCVDLSPTFASYSVAVATSGSNQVGYLRFGAYAHAVMWSGNSAYVDLHPAGASDSDCLAVSGKQQAGYAMVGGSYHAAMWSGTATSFIDLHGALGANYTTSMANGISNNGQVTYVVGYADRDAILWTVQRLPPNDVYVNRSYAGPTSDGSLQMPFKTITDGYQTVATNGTIIVFATNYPEPILMSKPLLLQATNGTVNIGTP